MQTYETIIAASKLPAAEATAQIAALTETLVQGKNLLSKVLMPSFPSLHQGQVQLDERLAALKAALTSAAGSASSGE